MLTDSDYMQRCFVLAENGRFTCRPNPAVGCVIVNNALVVGEGWHAVAGQGHAEVNALAQAGERASGATAYVSLEPCAHHGRTGPCAEALLKAGIVRVVYGMVDPNPLVAGKGLALLRDAGVEVFGPVLVEQAEQVNPGFNKRQRSGLPYVRCKIAMSLDGRTAMAGGESKWITGAAAREDVQHWRARSCAILTGIGTVLDDDPALTVRLPGFAGQQPMRVVVDSKGRIGSDAKLFVEPGTVLLVNAVQASPVSSHSGKTQVVHFADAQGRVDLRALLMFLAAEYGCNEVFVEAGATLSGSMLQAGLVDELLTYIAPSLLGHEGRPMALLTGLNSLSQRLELQFLDVAMLGKDCRIRSLPHNSKGSA